MQSARIVPTNNGLEFYSPYDSSLVDDLKIRVPVQARRPIYVDSKFSHWLVSPRYQATLEDLCIDHLGEKPAIQGSLFSGKPEKQTKVLECRYIGQPKAREDGSITAFAFCNGNWSVVFPESVLRDWFEPGMEARPNESTLYGLLAIKRDAPGAEVKAAYRKMALRFHPDHNKDDDAPEVFMKIQHAYEVLSNPQKRRKYEAGSTLAASLREPQYQQYKAIWRSPLRSGLVLVVCVPELGRHIVERIVQWRPIIDRQGRELVSSWDKTTNSIKESWVYV